MLVLAGLGKFSLWAAVAVDVGTALAVILNGMTLLRWRRAKAGAAGRHTLAAKSGSCCGQKQGCCAAPAAVSHPHADNASQEGRAACATASAAQAGAWCSKGGHSHGPDHHAAHDHHSNGQVASPATCSGTSAGSCPSRSASCCRGGKQPATCSSAATAKHDHPAQNRRMCCGGGSTAAIAQAACTHVADTHSPQRKQPAVSPAHASHGACSNAGSSCCNKTATVAPR